VLSVATASFDSACPERRRCFSSAGVEGLRANGCLRIVLAR
jgi:hypothetical protein